MVNTKYKKIFSIVFILSILIVLGLTISNATNYSKDEQNVSVNLNDDQRNCLNYNYEIPINIKVLDIISENELLTEKNNQLKIYNLTKKIYGEKLIDITENNSIVAAKMFDYGIIWIENNKQEKSNTKMFIKYFSSDKINLLDESNSSILPSMSITSKYVTYYIVDNNNINIKIFNLEKSSNRTIASYDLGSDVNPIQLSIPNTNDFDIVWSCSNQDKSQIYIYNIANESIKTLPKSELLSRPIIKNNRIFAIQKYDFFDKELNCDYASDYIVEYNNNEWDKFSKENIDQYVSYPREAITGLSTNQGLLYWTSTFKVKYVYDVINNKFISLTKPETNLQTTIKMVKDNIIYYQVKDNIGKQHNFIYIVPKE